MVTHACLMAIVIGLSTGRPADVRPPVSQDVLISNSQALVGVERLSVVVGEAGPEGRRIDASSLKDRIVERLSQAGIKTVDDGTGPVPRLVVRIENAAVPGCGRYVYRVQISLTRPVALPNRPDLPMQAEVWQARPVMEAVAKAVATEAILTAVQAQVEAFLAAHKAARDPRELTQDGKARVQTERAKSDSRSSPVVSGYPFISSKSSPVFHRPDCRWAQNIAAGNLIGYKSREEAVQAGQRPCRTCQP